MRDSFRRTPYGARGGASRWATRGRGRGASSNRAYPYPPSTSQSSPLAQPCVIYTRTGRCDQGAACRYKHDPEHVRLCQAFFMTGRCSSAGNTRCNMSHKPLPQNTPMCSHFARGRCDKPDCKFVHMTNLGDDPDTTEVCRQFAMVGWCDKGAGCNRRHCFDCPDFEAHGKCNSACCNLQHVIKTKKPRAVGGVVNAGARTCQSAMSVDAFVHFLESYDGKKSFGAPRALSKSNDIGMLDHTDDEPSAPDARGLEAASEGGSDAEEDEFDFVESMNAAQENHESIDTTADFVKV